MTEELLDLVDGNNTKIGTIGRTQIATLEDGGGRYIRATCAFVRNRNGMYWIPRRTADKRIAPNGFDFAMSEHMNVDESYLEAAVRGFDEELNMQIDPGSLRLAGILGPIPRAPYFAAIYLYESDVEPNYNPADFQDAAWLAPEEIIARIKSSVPAKDLLAPALKRIMLQEGKL